MMQRNGAIPMKVVFAAIIIMVVAVGVISIFTGKLQILGSAGDQSKKNIDKTGDLADQIGSGSGSDTDKPPCSDKGASWSCVPEGSTGYCESTDSTRSCEKDNHVCCKSPF